MGDKKKGSFQDYYLSQIRGKKIPVEVHCSNGALFEGTIVWYDSFTIILNYNNSQMMLYKHGIVAIYPRDYHAEIVQNPGERKPTYENNPES